VWITQDALQIMLQSSCSELTVELPDQLANAPLICRVIELNSLNERTPAPRARFALAKFRGANSTNQSRRTACRYLLHHLLSLTSVSKENDWELHYLSSGAPRLSNKGKSSLFDVSLAHSAEWLAAGMAIEARIGVDVERLRPHKNFSAMANYLDWKVPVRDILEFHEKWTLWEASVKCVEGSVLMLDNSCFSNICNINIRNKVRTMGQWSGLSGCLEEELYYSIVLQCENDVTMTHRILEPGKIEPW